MAQEGYYPSDEVRQANGRLREALGPYQDLVEVNGGYIRLSTHPRYVTIDCQQMRRHPDERVRNLAGQIEIATATTAESATG